MAAASLKSFGTLLKREISPGSGTYVTIGGLTNVNFPELQMDTIESTDMEAASAHRTHTSGMHSLGDVTADINYDSTDAPQLQMEVDAAAGVIRLYKIIAKDTGDADWAFDAYITRFAPTFSRDGLCVASITLKPTGVVTRS